MNVNSTIGLDATLVESRVRIVHQWRNTITLLFEKQNIMLIFQLATFGCSRSRRSKAATTCFSSGLGIWTVALQAEVTPMQ